MGLFDKFKIGLGKSSDGLSAGLKNIFSKKKIDKNVLTEFEKYNVWTPRITFSNTKDQVFKKLI